MAGDAAPVLRPPPRLGKTGGNILDHGSIMSSPAHRWNRWLASRIRRRALTLWQEAPLALPDLGASDSRRLLAEAEALRKALNRVFTQRPTRMPIAPDLPLQAEWGARPRFLTQRVERMHVPRPETGTTLAGDLRLYHDCPLREIVLCQQAQETGPTPFALTLETLAFEGSFLSLVIELPPEAAQGLRVRHVVSARLRIRAERDTRIFARINVRHGPNTEQQVNQIDLNAQEWHDQLVEFDLAYTRIAEKRVESLWLDLIIEKPAMNRVVLADVVLSRRPRAEI
jgi:hypothetical protein